MKIPTAKEFFDALERIERPKGRQLLFLKEHCHATARSSTATKLARAAEYKDYRGVNSGYGRLAKQLGRKLRRPNADITLLVEVLRPGKVTNAHWILVMRPTFAEALELAGWVPRKTGRRLRE